MTTREQAQATALYEQTLALFDQKHYKDCYALLALLDGGMALAPETGALYLLRGRVCHELKEYTQAKRAYKRAYDLDPCNWEILADLATTLAAQTEYTRAIELYDMVAELDLSPEEQAAICYNKAIVLAKMGELALALADYTRAIDLAPLSISGKHALVNRGNIFARVGKNALALADYQQAYALDPGDIQNAWMAWWSSSLSKKAITEELVTPLQAIEALDPEHYVAKLCRGIVAISDGDVPRAQEHFALAALQEPDQWDPGFWQGLAYALELDRKAYQAIEDAISLGLPPVLLAPLYWTQTANPTFFEGYAAPLLQSANL